MDPYGRPQSLHAQVNPMTSPGCATAQPFIQTNVFTIADEVAKHLAACTGAINELADRLAPVLGPVHPEKPAQECVLASMSPLAVRLVHLKDAIASDTERILQLIRRLEI